MLRGTSVRMAGFLIRLSFAGDERIEVYVCSQYLVSGELRLCFRWEMTGDKSSGWLEAIVAVGWLYFRPILDSCFPDLQGRQ